MGKEKITPNVIALAGTTVAILLVGIVGLVGSLLVDSADVSVVFLGLIAYPLYQYVSLKRTEYMITDQKVISNVDFGGERHEEVGFSKIQNTSLKMPFLYQLVGNYGNISISTAGSNRSALTLRAVENPREIHERIVNKIDDPEPLKQDDSIDPYEEYQKLAMSSERLKNEIKGDKL